VSPELRQLLGSGPRRVVVDRHFNRLKLKHPIYVKLHHLRTGLNSQRAIVDVVRQGEANEVLACLPEFTTMIREAQQRYEALIKELEVAYQKIETIPIQRDFAQAALKTRCSSALFAVRAKKAPSIRHYLTTLRIEQLVELLGYKRDTEINSTE
jgi:hypothetical protein